MGLLMRGIIALSPKASSPAPVIAVIRGRGRALTPLTRMAKECILMHMRTTINIDDDLLREAQRLSGLREKTALVHAGLEAVIARESARHLALLGGSDKSLKSVPRRRPRKKA